MADSTNQTDLIAALGGELEKMNAAASLETGACVLQTYDPNHSEICLQTTEAQCQQVSGAFLGVGVACPFNSAG